MQKKRGVNLQSMLTYTRISTIVWQSWQCSQLSWTCRNTWRSPHDCEFAWAHAALLYLFFFSWDKQPTSCAPSTMGLWTSRTVQPGIWGIFIIVHWWHALAGGITRCPQSGGGDFSGSIPARKSYSWHKPSPSHWASRTLLIHRWPHLVTFCQFNLWKTY